MRNILVYTDGSATIASKPGGYGWVIVIDGNKHSEGSGSMERATNNDAELEASVRGLAAVLKFLVSDAFYSDIETSVTLVSDSQIVLGWADGTYRCKQKEKQSKYDKLQYLVKRLNVKTRWVKGHSGDEHNERCDKLANEARKKLMPHKPKKEPKASKSQPISTTGGSLIGHKMDGVLNIWYKGMLKIIDLEAGIVENYDEAIHGSRHSRLELNK